MIDDRNPFKVADVIRRFRIRYTHEADLQLAIEEIFQSQGIAYEREVRLTARDRPDFVVQECIAVEIKIKWPASKVLRQLRRYAQHDSIFGLVLVTTRHLHAVQMPQMLEGKPLAVCLIGGL